MCLVKTTPLHRKAGKIWQIIASNYLMMKEKMKAKAVMLVTLCDANSQS
jgi:hypothetical protein